MSSLFNKKLSIFDEKSEIQYSKSWPYYLINILSLNYQDEGTESCNEEEGNKVHATLASAFDAPFVDCQSALSFYRKKLDIFGIDVKSICGKVNQELLMKFVFKTESRKAVSRNMHHDEDPIRADITFGEMCNCTCGKDMDTLKQWNYRVLYQHGFKVQN